MAAELELNPLAQPRRLLPHALAHWDRPGERDRAYAWVGDERLADLGAAADHDVEHAVRKPGLFECSRQMETRERGILGELQHDRVSVRQRRCGLPGRDRGGEVPRSDQTDDAQRPAARVHRRPGSRLLVDLADRSPALAREEPEDRRGSRRLQAGFAQGLAHLSGHVPRDLLHPRLDRVRGAGQERSSLGGGQLGPLQSRGLGRVDCGGDVFGV